MNKESTISEGEGGEGRGWASPSCIPSALGRRPGKVSETCCPPLGAGSVALKRDAVITSELTPPGPQGAGGRRGLDQRGGQDGGGPCGLVLELHER